MIPEPQKLLLLLSSQVRGTTLRTENDSVIRSSQGQLLNMPCADIHSGVNVIQAKHPYNSAIVLNQPQHSYTD